MRMHECEKQTSHRVHGLTSLSSMAESIPPSELLGGALIRSVCQSSSSHACSVAMITLGRNCTERTGAVGADDEAMAASLTARSEPVVDTRMGNLRTKIPNHNGKQLQRYNCRKTTNAVACIKTALKHAPVCKIRVIVRAHTILFRQSATEIGRHTHETHCGRMHTSAKHRYFS